MTHKKTLDLIRTMVSELDWGQFHTPDNLAKSISIEAAELLEQYQWGSDADSVAVEEELADVLTYCFLLADSLGLDADSIVQKKVETTRQKYPVDKARGKSTKYDRL